MRTQLALQILLTLFTAPPVQSRSGDRRQARFESRARCAAARRYKRRPRTSRSPPESAPWLQNTPAATSESAGPRRLLKPVRRAVESLRRESPGRRRLRLDEWPAAARPCESTKERPFCPPGAPPS